MPSPRASTATGQPDDERRADRFDCDWAVIGSGFGGAVAALRLAEKGHRVTVLEQGRRWSPEQLPASNWNLRRWLWAPAAGLRGFFGMRLFRHVLVLHGNAVGGGSIAYANTLLQAPAKVWDEGGWAGLADWQRIMPECYARARRMLGVARNRRVAEADRRLQRMARECGLEDGFHLTDVGVYFGDDDTPPGTPHPDPYFAGEGPPRRSCIGCGACMVGCRHGAKNTLDLNYLHLAERRGARLLAETRVEQLRPLGADDGSDGYELVLSNGRWPRRTRRRLRCRGVVVAASSLGTQSLLLRMKADGQLPRLSDALGSGVRTNAESLIGVRFAGSSEDLSRGIAIGSGLWLDAHTHVEATRYAAGSDAMGLLATPMARSGRGRLRMRLARRWWWPFSRQLRSHGPRIPSHIPAAEDFARRLAARFGGSAMASLPEVLLDIPMTAHCLGGACIGADADSGVCDANGRMFGYRNLLMCDGSLIAANLGVNPSLTITALAEHVMQQLPPADGDAGLSGRLIPRTTATSHGRWRHSGRRHARNGCAR